MKKNKRSGFTVVELVIVIAVIAVLAAVLIPTFASLIRQANQSVDQQLVNNLNKILMAEEAVEGKNPYMHAAVLDLAENGYSISALKLNDTEGRELVWDSTYDRFIIVSPDLSLRYCSESDKKYYYEGTTLGLGNHKARCWKVYTSADYVDGKLSTNTICSIYWGETVLPDFGEYGVFDYKGLDLGYCTEKLDWTGKGQQEANNNWLVFNGENAIVRGNFSQLLINVGGTKHFGSVDTLILKLQSGDHHEYGQVGAVQLVTIGSQTQAITNKLVAEKGSQFEQTKEQIEILITASKLQDNGGEFGATFGN